MGLTTSDLVKLGPKARKQALDKLMQQNRLRENKYHNKTDSRGKVKFDSKKEARRYDELMLLLNAGKIRHLKLQKQFTLQDSYVTPEGERIRSIVYIADFYYERPTEPDVNGVVYWIPVVEDVKSQATRTDKYAIKKKMLHDKFGLSIVEV